MTEEEEGGYLIKIGKFRAWKSVFFWFFFPRCNVRRPHRGISANKLTHLIPVSWREFVFFVSMNILT